MSVKRKVLWTVIHVLRFLVVVVIFYLGLGVGLAVNPWLGTFVKGGEKMYRVGGSTGVFGLS